jgi:bzd-type benzoyl-CoA reductase N subunit
MDDLALFNQVVADPSAYARQWKAAHGGRVVGHLCSYTPEEFIVAAGALPYRIFGSNAVVSKADAHLQAYACSLVRGALEDALDGALDFLDGVVFPHTCDSIQRLSDIWRINGRFGFHLDVVMPVKLTTGSAREYMARVVGAFCEQLQQALGVTIEQEDLAAAVTTYNRLRERIGRLYALKAQTPGVISGRELNTIVRAAAVMDRKDFTERLERVVAQVEARQPRLSAEPKRVVLSGGVCSLTDIYQIIEEAGGAVVWDDLCTGTRAFGGPIPLEGDLVAAISHRYLERIVCPAKHAGLAGRGEDLLAAVRRVDGRGVIFLFLKFCDPHGFDYPMLKSMLDEAGIPSMLFEVEDRVAAEGQLRTRVEAFLEMI